MSASDSGIPSNEGVTQQQQSWWLQVRLAWLSRWRGISTPGRLGFRFYLGVFAGFLSVLMIWAPVYVFISYLRSGVLFLSPPLLLTFLAGWAGLPIGTATLGGKLERDLHQATTAEQREAAQW